MLQGPFEEHDPLSSIFAVDHFPPFWNIVSFVKFSLLSPFLLFLISDSTAFGFLRQACDLWSIGVITYILLAGYPPFYGESDQEIFASVRHGYFDFPSPEWDKISTEAKDFITQLLQKDPTARMSASESIRHRWFEPAPGEEPAEKPSAAGSGSTAAGVEDDAAKDKLGMQVCCLSRPTSAR